MSKIAYDPVKDSFAKIVRKSKKLRRGFYFILDLFFLRGWHIRKILRQKGHKLDKKGEWFMLDAGSGFGQYDRFLLDRFSHIKLDSIDIKKEYLEDNRNYFQSDIQKGRVSFLEADILSFTSNKLYNFILCVDVLEHIDDDEAAIHNMSRLLDKEGLFLMHSPSHHSEEDADEDDTFVGEHARTGYSKAEIEKKLMEADLLPLKSHYTYGKWGRRAWILSIKWPMIWFTKIGLTAFLPLFIYYPLVFPFCLLMNRADLYTKNYKGNGIYVLAKKI